MNHCGISCNYHFFRYNFSSPGKLFQAGKKVLPDAFLQFFFFAFHGGLDSADHIRSISSLPVNAQVTVYFRTGNHIDELHGYGCCSDIYSHHDRAGTVSFRSIRFPVGYGADYFHFLLGFFLCYHRHISDRITGTGQTVSLTQLLRSEDSFIRRGNRCLSLRHPDPAFPTGSSPGTDRGHINPLLPENFQHGLFVSAY